MIEESKLVTERQRIISELTSARIEKGISQQALADMIGTKRSNICRIEGGGQNITLDMMLKMSAALEKDVLVTLNERRVSMDNEKSNYSLRLYDDELVSFSLYKEGLAGLKAEILSINEKRKSLFPLDLELSNQGIVKWLSNRVIPKNRAFVGEILKQLSLTIDDTKGIIDICKGLSLNDSFWVVPEGFTGKFADFNLFENPFSEILSLVAYTGNAGSHEVFTTSPELTTNGALPKAWRSIENDGIYLYKGGTSGAANTGNEPYSEYYACQVAKCMGLRAVYYDLEQWKGILASKCKLFTDIDTSFVPIGRVMESGGISACLEYYKSLGKEALEQLKDMLVFDAVIYNEDRHFGNFGLLRNNRTGEIIGPAPIFDNGLSLFCYAMPDYFDNIADYAQTLSNPYGVSYTAICKEVMGTRQRNNLRKLMNFTFTRHPQYNLPEERLQSIEKQLRTRSMELLSLPRVKTKGKTEPER